MGRRGLIFLKHYHKKGLTVKVIIHKWKIFPKIRRHILSLGKYQIRPGENNSMDYQLIARVFDIASWYI